ncbi:metal ABC transporter substrate-binding protein [Clavibacter californiensis]|uniref:ABC transporter substrate-binding protein n=1 Tax=Clavibacter californiensis TaxID=1401995 RepID=A0ABX9N837_9MICO|nr:zinc ABC transporter substrate-binding protein [Clavibacter californiensis]RII90701.1 ABC transporter substrate-binding protein [Clavibacter californiensis]UKF80448.1 zinc ABC transporter substrate-binding protein [Clavibacter californiensis]
MNRRPLTALLAVSLLAVPLAGCASGSATPAADASSSASGGGTLEVVASTDVYGDIAQQIGGDDVKVTSIIDSPDKDPHEYQATSRDQLTLSTADVVIQNGGGYDDFVDTMIKALPGGKSPVLLNAVDISGFDQKPAEGELNEHVWYDMPTMKKLAAEIEQAFSKADSAGAATFEANEQAFTAKLDGIAAAEAAAKPAGTGKGVAITEPVPLYMTSAMGLENRTPDEFSEAVEEGTDVPADVLKETLALFAEKKVAALVYNSQTTGATTDQVVAAAKAAGVPVVPVTETLPADLPAGSGYVEWMTENVDAVASAIRGS